MFSKNTLDYIIYKKNASNDQFEVLGITENLSVDDATIWRGLVTIDPMSAGDDSSAIGVFKGPETDFLLARTQNFSVGDEPQAIYQNILLPDDVLGMLSGNVNYLLESSGELKPLPKQTEPLPPLEMPPVPTWTPTKRFELFSDFLDEDTNMDQIFDLLGAALDERQVVVVGVDPRMEQRLKLVQGLMMLLPTPARSRLTFSTHVNNAAQAKGRIVFADEPGETSRWLVDFENHVFPDSESVASPYIEFLKSAWTGNFQALIAELRTTDLLAHQLMHGQTLQAGLSAVAERYSHDQQVLAGEIVSSDNLKRILDESPPPDPELRRQYVRRLFNHCLEERDTEAVEQLSDLVSDEQLIDMLNETVNDEPDAVYFFLRTRLGEEADDAWLTLLHSAAALSLQVAITDGDTETLMSWLRLISREPASYQLGEILRNGVLAAQERTHEDSELGHHLLTFVCKRAPHLIDTLLTDTQFIQALAVPIGSAIRDFDSDALTETLALSREVGLVVMRQMLDADDKIEGVFTSAQINHLWDAYVNNALGNLPEKYQPAKIIASIIGDDSKHLMPVGIERLFTNLIVAGEDDLYIELATRLSQSGQLEQNLINIYATNALPLDTVLAQTNQLQETDVLSPQETINIYQRLAASRDWDAESVPLVDGITRQLRQDHDLTVPIDIMWRMLAVAGETQSEVVARVMTRRILQYVAELDDENQPTDALNRLDHLLEWSASARNYMLGWMREYAQEQSLAQLQRIERALEGNKRLDEAHAIVETTIALRKMLGTRTVEEFARDVDTAYAVLLGISDSFDPVNKQSVNFDELTMQGELDSQDSSLSPDERSVFANNLKELAQLIISMSDHRRKASLIRSEEDIDRQLLSGEQSPGSAIDTMKWLSGFLNGARDKSEDE